MGEFPTQRVFRPKSDEMNMLIQRLMAYHVRHGNITNPSWTEYVAFLLNRDIAEIRAKRNTARR